LHWKLLTDFILLNEMFHGVLSLIGGVLLAVLELHIGELIRDELLRYPEQLPPLRQRGRQVTLTFDKTSKEKP